jgi:hypothetical protein
MKDSTTLFIPAGYGKGTIIRDLDGKPWIVGDTVISPIHEVHPIEEEVAVKMLEQGAKLIISTHQ